MSAGRVAVIGGGAWGTALAKSIAEKGHSTAIWCRREDQAAEINSTHTNSRYLGDVRLPRHLYATGCIEEAADDREFIILASPSLYILEQVKLLLNVRSVREGKTSIAVLTKGFLPSPAGPRLIIDTLEDYLPDFYKGRLVYISGPSHAEEVAQGKITGLIAASRSVRESIRFRYLLKSKRLLVFSSLDVRGVQVAAAVKNVIAIAFGVLDALKAQTSGVGHDIFGDNTESLLLASGLNEIQMLGRAMGATHPETFTSIAGAGDLDVTCRSVYGRNRRFGREIIEKQIIAPYKNIDGLIADIGRIGYMPEGIAACKHVNCLLEKYRLKMPICRLVYRILNKDVKAENALNNYLNELR
jgi:glycerol-3-phosphate dehydrogenase (NAD(P)+)